MRIIPGNTKVKVEIFNNFDLWDLLVAVYAGIMLATILVSTLPVKIAFVSVHVLISVVLIARLDKEANYRYLMHIIRHYGIGRFFDRLDTDDNLKDLAKRGDSEVAFDELFPDKGTSKEAPVFAENSDTEAKESTDESVERAAEEASEETAEESAEETVEEEEVLEERPPEPVPETKKEAKKRLKAEKKAAKAAAKQAKKEEAAAKKEAKKTTHERVKPEAEPKLNENGEVEETLEEPELTKAEKKQRDKERKKAEKAEYDADTKLLKSKTLTQEEEDAIWLKRSQQAEAKKKEKQESKAAEKKGKEQWQEMADINAFTGITEGFIEYKKGKYYGAVIEIPSVEFKFFGQFRRNRSIESAFGQVLRMVKSDLCTNIVKVERPVSYDHYIRNEQEKLDELRASYEQGFIKEEELKSRVAIVYDRIYALQEYKDNNKIVIPFYYLVIFDNNKVNLKNMIGNVIDILKIGEMDAKYIKDPRDIATFLKYTNDLDFDEADAYAIRNEDLVTWAMPQSVEFTARNALVNGMATHNFRIVDYPTKVYDAWLASLLTYPSTKVVIKTTPMDAGKAIKSIDKSLSELRAKLNSARTDSEAIDTQTHIETLQLLLTTLQSESETLLSVNVYITGYDPVFTNENPKFDNLPKPSYRYHVNGMKKAIRRIWKEAGFKLNNNEFNQAISYIGSQVSGYDPFFDDGRGMPSNTIAAAFPWIYPHVMDEKGVQLGTSDEVPVFIDFFKRDSERVNSNMVIVGKSGSGKSFATKSILTNLAADDSKIFILDPEDEYSQLAKNLNGKFINVANAKYGRLNPFHIITTLDDDESSGGDSASSSYATHLQFLEEFFKQILPDCDKDSLEYLNSLIDRVYASKGITPYTELSKLLPTDYPTFDDLYDEILREFQHTDNEYIKTMLRTLMNYVSKFSEGGRNSVIWNGPSTVTTEENFTVFNFQSLLANRNTTIANAQMLLVLKYIDNEVIKNRDYNEKYNLNRKVVVVIDEAHVFIDTKFPVALDFMFQLAKRIRKYNGMQIIITQNIKDFVGSEEIARKSTAIINACQYSFIFSLAPNDMEDLCKLYEKAGGINESEQEQIVQAQRGHAFTVMTPTSRTSFKVTVPADVRAMFKADYKNPYFTGSMGETYWEEYMKDSRDKRRENLIAKGIDPDKQEEAAVGFDGFEEISEAPSIVEFDEFSPDEFVEKLKAQPAGNELKIEKLDPTKMDFETSDEPIIPEINLNAAPSAETVEFAELKKEIAPQTMLAAQGLVKESVESRNKTEEILAGLVDKLSTANMMDEIKKAVKEELTKEMESRGVPATPAESAPAAKAEESSSESLGLSAFGL